MFLFQFIAASLFFCIGILGLIATLNEGAIVRLSYEKAVVPAARYYKACKWTFFVMAFLILIAAVMWTVGISIDYQDPNSPLKEVWQVVLLAVFIWLCALVSVVVQLYFLYVIWSYQTKLEAAFHGRPYGQFVIQGQQPRPTEGPILPTAPFTEYSYERRLALRNTQ